MSACVLEVSSSSKRALPCDKQTIDLGDHQSLTPQILSCYHDELLERRGRGRQFKSDDENNSYYHPDDYSSPPPPPPPTQQLDDPHELDLTPRLAAPHEVARRQTNGWTNTTRRADADEPVAAAYSPSPSPVSSAAAVIYEQPALERRLSNTNGVPLGGSVSTFRMMDQQQRRRSSNFEAGRRGGHELEWLEATAVRNNKQHELLATPPPISDDYDKMLQKHRETRRRRSTTNGGRNSLESIQSRESATSSATSPPPPNTNDENDRDNNSTPSLALKPHRHSTRNSILIGTRYVSPPAVPVPVRSPALSPPPPQSPSDDHDDRSPTVDCDWRDVPLTECAVAKKKKKLDIDTRQTRTRAAKSSRRWNPLIFRLFRRSECNMAPRAEDKDNGRSSARRQEQKYYLDNSGNKNSGGGVGHAHKTTSGSDSSSFSPASLTEKSKQSKSPNGNSGASSPPPPPRSRSSLPAQPQRQLQIGKSRAPFLFAGILGSILGSLFFSLGMLTIKLLPDDRGGHGLAEKTKIVCFRGLIMMILCAGTILYQKSTFIVRRDELLVNVLRSLLGFAGVFGAYVSLKYISMGDSTALVFSSPVWTSLLSHFILNEPLQWIQLLALPLSILGIVLIAHPSLLISMDQATAAMASAASDLMVDGLLVTHQAAPPAPLGVTASILTASNNITSGSSFQEADNSSVAMIVDYHEGAQRWKGIATALATSFIVSFVYIVLKFRKTTPIQTTTFWLGFTTFSGALVLSCCIGFGSWPRGALEWTLLLFNGLCSWLGQCLLQWGLKYEDASVLSVVRTLDVAMTFTLSAIFLDEQILWTSVLGASIIATVVISIMLNNYISSQLCPASGAGTQDDNSSLRSSITLSTGEGCATEALDVGALSCKQQQLAADNPATTCCCSPLESNAQKSRLAAASSVAA